MQQKSCNFSHFLHYNINKHKCHMRKLPLYNIVLGSSDGIQVMSLVESPAVESNFIALTEQSKPMMFSVDEDKHIVTGCALRADFPIYRRDKDNFEYYVVFSKDVILQLRDKFMREQKTAMVNLEHQTPVDGCFLISSYIKDTSNGINPVQFSDIPDGSWMTSYKIENEDVWKQIKSGDFKGFSIEGTFDFQLAPQKDELEELIDEIL